MRNQLALATSIFLVFGCSSEAMHDESGELHAALADQRAETARHESACEVANSMSDVLADLDRHVQTMNGIQFRMDAGMHEMLACSQADSDRISAGMTDVRAELGDHRLRLEASSDLAVAHRECIRYAPMMEAALMAMSKALGDMSCMMMSH